MNRGYGTRNTCCRLFLHARLVVIGTALLLSACSSTDEIAQSDWEKLVAIRAEAQSYRAEMVEDSYNVDTQGQSSRFPEIRRRYQSLITTDNIKLLKRIEDHFREENSPEGERIKLLRLFLTEGCRQVAVASHNQELQAAGAELTLVLDGDTIDYNDAVAIMTSESNRDRRERLSNALLPVLRNRNRIHRSLRATEDSLLAELGYHTTLDFPAEYHRVNVDTLSRMVQSFLTATDSLYFSLFAEIAPQVTGITYAAFRGYDFDYLVRAKCYDHYFEDHIPLEMLSRTLSGLGIEIDSFSALTLKLGEQTVGSPRAVTYPVNVPADIRVSVPLVGGHEDFGTLYHEVGHALHHLYTTERDFEYIYLGDAAVTEAYAFLLEYFLDDPKYLTDYVGLNRKEVTEYLRFRAFMRLMQVRSGCADFLFERILYSQITAAESTYVRIREDVLGYPLSEVERMTCFERAEYLHSADYLRAWFLAAQLRDKLRREYGESYFSSRAAGDYLKQLWGYGNRLTVDRLAEIAGVGEISPDALIVELQALADH